MKKETPLIKLNKGSNSCILEVIGNKAVVIKQTIKAMIAHAVGTQNTCQIVFPAMPRNNKNKFKKTNDCGEEKYLKNFRNIE